MSATASFASLISAVLSSNFFTTLDQLDYTELVVQYGADGEPLYDSRLKEVESAGQLTGIKVSGFALDHHGLGPYMRMAKTGGDKGIEGVVISHAGSGSILDALRISVPLIVVPNAELLDNHQVELAEALAEQEYVVHGTLENLPQALGESETLRMKQQQWPPVNSGVHRQTKGLASVLDEEMGFLD
ncbi:hypothetical protein MBLNU459_g0648t1 [Dothideomycetes sp. NU459]